MASGVSGQIAISDVTDGSLDESGEDGSTSTITRTSTETVSENGEYPGYNQTKVQAIFLELLNEERADRGLQELEPRDALKEMGEEHSANMAKHEYVGHVWPDGTTIEDRYRQRGLLPECRLPIQSSNEFYQGAENAAQTWIGRNLVGPSNVTRINSERDLAKNLFEMWMNSEGHREAMLVSSADEAGLGLNISSSGKVYSALELC